MKFLDHCPDFTIFWSRFSGRHVPSDSNKVLESDEHFLFVSFLSLRGAPGKKPEITHCKYTKEKSVGYDKTIN